MSLQLRRVATGPDANGRAVVKIDEVETRYQEVFIPLSARPRSTANVRVCAKPHSRPELYSSIIFRGRP